MTDDERALVELRLPAGRIEAVELAVECSYDGWPECLGIYRDAGGVIYITGYHFGPGGPLLTIHPDGRVLRGN